MEQFVVGNPAYVGDNDATFKAKVIATKPTLQSTA